MILRITRYGFSVSRSARSRPRTSVAQPRSPSFSRAATPTTTKRTHSTPHNFTEVGSSMLTRILPKQLLSPGSSFSFKLHSTFKMKSYPNLVFGYGSLICPNSRAITAPTVADRTALPVSIKGVERTWTKKSQTSKATSMGVQFRDGAECVGILVPVDDEELSAFDKREVGYDRYEVPVEDVEPVFHLLGDDDAAPSVYENTFLEQGFDVEHAEDVPHVWIYIQQDPIPATPEYPIAQSYVDVMLRGCLTISEEFAEEFIQTTKGWHPAELLDSEDSEESMSLADSETSDIDEEVGWWVDDRRDPLYVRADSDYSLRHSKKLDSLLKENLPGSRFGRRIRRGKSQVLKQ